MTADDQSARLGKTRERLQQDVHSLPRVEMSGVRNHWFGRDRGRRGCGRADAVRHDRHSLPWTEALPQFVRQPPCDRHVTVRPLPHALFAPGEPLHFRRTGLSRGGEHGRQRSRDVGRVAVRFVHEPGTRCRRNAQQRGRHAEIARHRDIRARTAENTSEGEREVADARGDPGSGRSVRALDDERLVLRETVEGERISRRRLRVALHHEADVVSALRQRITRLHRLDAVGALEGEADVGEVEDAHQRCASPLRES